MVQYSGRSKNTIGSSINPQTKQPIGPDELKAIFPMGLIKQEVSTERYILIPEEVREMINHALKGKFLDSREILKELLLKRGMAGQDVIKQISRQIYTLDVSEQTKANLIEKVGDFEFRMQTGNELIQLEALLAQFAVLKG